MKISKRVREQAAWLASVAACHGTGPVTLDAQKLVSKDSRYFYYEAWAHVFCSDAYQLSGASSPILGAEAEALIRTGWCPP